MRGTHTDGVNLDLHVARYFSGGFGSNHTGVVGSVGYHDNTFGHGLAVLDSVDRRDYAIAYCCSICRYKTDFHAIDVVGQHGAVCGQRNCRVTFAGKQDKTEIIIAAAGDKLRGNFLSSFQTVGVAEVSGTHTGRNIQSKHNIGAFDRCTAPVVVRLRTRQNDYKTCYGSASHGEEYMP